MLQHAKWSIRWFSLWLIVLLPGVISPIALADESPIEIVVERPEDVGLEGYVRPGTWAPMRITLRNKQPVLRNLNVDWIAPDADGDLVIARREKVVVPANGSAGVRLYAMPATSSKPADGWTVRVVDAETDQAVTSLKVAPKFVMALRNGAIGIAGGGLMGLGSFRDVYTQHEPIDFITGIDPSLLPDRWYGLRLLDALVWGPQAARSPADPSVPLAAIKEWVRRGGHLVVVLSPIDTGWSDPKVADLLPPVDIGDSRELPAAPRWLYETSDPLREETRPENAAFKFNVRPFSRRSDATMAQASLLIPGQLSGGADEPSLVASHQYGFGRVTLIGLDLTDRRIALNSAFVRYGLPRLWQTVFGWRSPGNLDAAKLIDDRRMVPMNGRESTDLGSFIPGRIAMKSTASATVFGAVLLFGVYWVIAGPAMFAVLKARSMLHHSWMVYGIIVLAFSAIAWGTAVFLRPGFAEIEHFSIVDIDSSSQSYAQIRTHTYFSLFFPKHGEIDVAIETPKERSNLNALASPGLPDGDRSSFVDVRQYQINTLATSRAENVPMRSTAKQFEAHYCDILDNGTFAKHWAPPVGLLTIKEGWPSGMLVHQLPGTLTNVRLIYCPGDGKPARLWNPAPSERSWRAGAPLTVARALDSLALVDTPEKVQSPDKRKKTSKNPQPNGWDERTLSAEGVLGAHLEAMGGQRSDTAVDDKTKKLVDPGSSTIVRSLELMAFYNMLPPPQFMVKDDVHFSWTPVHFTRRMARSVDISHLTTDRRLIILGHIESDCPLPMPLKVEGETLKSRGWTMVRFVLKVEE